MATYEIVYQRRLVKDGPSKAKVVQPGTAVTYFRENCFADGEMWREKVYALFLDMRKRPLGHLLVGVGSDTAVTVSNKVIAKAALDALACGVILCHNHPSGDPKPGKEDIEATKSLGRALKTLDITLVDHIILGENGYFSFSEDSELKYQ